jgi:hypothetical protein
LSSRTSRISATTRVEQRPEVDALEALLRVARDGQQRVDRRLQPIDLRERGGQLRRPVVAQRQRLELDAKRRKRGAQLMRRIGGERALAGDELVEQRGGRVERACDGVDLRDPLARGAHREVALAQPRRRGRDALERDGEPPAQRAGREHRQHQHARADGGEQQPGLADVGDRAALVAGCAHRSGDVLAAQQRHGDQQLAGGAAVGGSGGAQRGANDRVGTGRAAAGDAAPGGVVDGQAVARARQLDGVASLLGEVDLARRRDRVALQAQEVLVAIRARQQQRERQGEQDHRQRRDARDRGDQPPPHDSSKR